MQELRVIVHKISEIDHHLIVEHMALAYLGLSGLWPMLKAVRGNDVLHQVPVVEVAIVVVAILDRHWFGVQFSNLLLGRDGFACLLHIDLSIGK